MEKKDNQPKLNLSSIGDMIQYVTKSKNSLIRDKINANATFNSSLSCPNQYLKAAIPPNICL